MMQTEFKGKKFKTIRLNPETGAKEEITLG